MNAEKLKMPYESADIKLVLFGFSDIITTSSGEDDGLYDDEARFCYILCKNRVLNTKCCTRCFCVNRRLKIGRRFLEVLIFSGKLFACCKSSKRMGITDAGADSQERRPSGRL